MCSVITINATMITNEVILRQNSTHKSNQENEFPSRMKRANLYLLYLRMK